MIFSSATSYALHAMAALPEDGSFCQARELAARLGLPGPYLAKIMRALVHEGLLDSVPGPTGGFRLARHAHQITVGEIVEVLDGKDTVSGCVLGFPSCQGHHHPCALYVAWQAIAGTTIRDITLLDRGVSGRPGRPGGHRPALGRSGKA